MNRTPILGRLRVGAKLILIPTLFILAIAGTLAYTVFSLQDQQQDAQVIELVGRQRAFAQRYLKEILLAARGLPADPQATRQLFEESGRGLLEGTEMVLDLDSGERGRVPPAPTQAIRAALSQANDQFASVARLAEAFLALPPDDPASPTRLQELLDEGEALQRQLRRVVDLVTEHSQAKVQRMIRWETGIALSAALVGLLLSLWLTRSVTGPLERVVQAAQEVARGNLGQEPLPVVSSDELGTLARVFNEMLSSLRDLVAQSQAASEDLNAACAQIATSTRQQAASTAEQLAAVHQTTTTMEEVGQSGAQVSERARQVGAAAQATATASLGGLQAVQGTSRTMGGIREQVESMAEYIVSLSERTQAIGEIISTVDDLAERVNLLALNAAIEAAGAGEEGRRFAVVAGELKSLADQSKASTVQVRAILGDIQKGIHSSVLLTEEAVKRVETGRREAQEAEQTIRAMADTVQESVQAFQQIVAATNQQQIGFEQVAAAMQNIRVASEQTAQGIGQLESAANNLTALSQRMRQAVERFQV